ncbi:MAG: hypothetical protein AABX47_06130 [Nanoarchaeota archaeon]
MILNVIEGVFLGNKTDTYSRLVNYMDGFDQFILYHGTSEVFRDGILRKGLKCRGVTENSVYGKGHTEGKPSDSGLVYVSNFHWACRMGLNAAHIYGGEMTVFQFLIKKEDLVADEDSGKPTGVESLAWEGTAAVRDIISPRQIVGVFNVHSCPDWGLYDRLVRRLPRMPLDEKVVELAHGSFQ